MKKTKQSVVSGMIVLSIIVVLFGVVLYPKDARAQIPFLPTPFGGRLTNTDYVTCSCGSLVLTVQDTRTGMPIRIIYIYALDLLKKFGIIPDIIPVPTLYLYYNVFLPNVQHLGQYVPVPNAPCLVIIPTFPFCAISYPGAVGYLYQAGTSLTPF